ncbi:MAG: hypothetical protein IKG61_03355 [Selenomonadaceae bacterium]|nr:hypothetical protein [Selenomonadaceae bacterium]
MEIVYINPGYTTGLTGTGLTCVESEEYNPINGVAFTGNFSGDGRKFYLPLPSSAFDVPTVSDSQFFTKMISFKFSVYLDLVSPYTTAAGFQKDKTKTTSDYNYVSFGYSNCKAYFVIGNNNTTQDIIKNKVTAGFHNVVLSICLMKYLSGSSNAFYVVTYCEVDGDLKSYRTGFSSASSISSVFGQGIYVALNGTTTSTITEYFSNIIVASSTEISSTSPSREAIPAPILSSDTTLVRLPLSTPSGNFSAEGDGKYVGTASGQQLLQTIDATDLITKFGGDTKVNNLIVYGNPGYRTGNGITTAYGGSTDDYGDGKFTTKGSCTLSADPNAIASVAWDETENGTTLEIIDGWEVGWKI